MKKLNKLILIFIGASAFASFAEADMVDPTKPAGYVGLTQTNVALGSLELTAIFDYRTYKVAIIDGHALKVGDTISGYTVTTINKDSVELTDSQNRKELMRLNINDVKQPAKGF